MQKLLPLVGLCAMFGWMSIHGFVHLTTISAEKSKTTTQTVVTSKTISSKAQDVKVGLQIGNFAPDFTVETLKGEKISLKDYRGKQVMLNFWATWCPPCQAEIPEMQQFYHDNDVEVLAVNLTATESSVNAVKVFTDEYGLLFPILLDKDDQLSTTYHIQPIPTTFMIDTKGIIQHKFFGALNQEQMEQALRSME
ncbi:thiol-disulfide oxidoreductase ResA [Paraliobacillus ryukyuensis]|uniref:Peroxiredoxin n=1 Tax=Paraliobacillus ryukyuensis TaxID=200904 RepID=A0A366DWX5_9BACI|nr:redoxin domain-containing protein [Paraliobacillus ryukyuensis]RBO94596.1 peroxiredoxin [Paraliobacillus ryukyuensis]